MKAFLIGASLLLLASCATTISTPPVIMPVANQPIAQPMNLNPVEWKVLTLNDLKDLITSMQQNPDQHTILYALDNGNFQALDFNLNEMKRYIEEQKQVILFYQKLEGGKVDSKVDTK